VNRLSTEPEFAKVKVFKVDGEINTDDFSPAGDAWSRPDIPLHALAMGRTRFKGGLDTIAKFRKDGFQVAFVGDVVIAEPKALIGFAGPRVIEQTVRETLPEGFQRSEFMLKHGAIDMIVDRREMREKLAALLTMLLKLPAAT